MRQSTLTRLDAAAAIFAAVELLSGCGEPPIAPASLASVPKAQESASPPRRLRLPTDLPPRIEVSENSLGMKFVRLPAGEFLMGSPESDPHVLADEKPQHRVEITEPFDLGMHEVTVAQFRRFVNETGHKTEAEISEGGYAFDPAKKRLLPNAKGSWRWTGFEQGDDHPVINVCWHDAVAFCKWLSKKEGQTYRLPTEIEWEYACRAGTETFWNTGNDIASLEGHANLCDVRLKEAYPFSGTWTVDWDDGYAFTAPVGSFPPNAFGLYDMVGNVFEFCQDDWPEKTYDGQPLILDDERPEPDSRIIRGGSYLSLTRFLRSADRVGLVSRQRNCIVGFRVAREVEPSISDGEGTPAKAELPQ